MSVDFLKLKCIGFTLLISLFERNQVDHFEIQLISLLKQKNVITKIFIIKECEKKTRKIKLHIKCYSTKKGHLLFN